MVSEWIYRRVLDASLVSYRQAMRCRCFEVSCAIRLHGLFERTRGESSRRARSCVVNSNCSMSMSAVASFTPESYESDRMGVGFLLSGGP